jgi:hypothetical protein
LSKARPRDHDDDGAAGAADDDGDDHRGAAIIVIAALAVDTVRSKRLSERRGLVVVECAFKIAGFPIFDGRRDTVSGLDLDVGIRRR